MENKRIEASQEGDSISRLAAVDALEREKTYCRAFREGYTSVDIFEKYNAGLTDGIKAIENLPSAQPERKRGKWIENDNGTYSCNRCQSWIPKEQRYYANFCLFCGADMREENR